MQIKTINFKNIIPHNGDQKTAFEELVCQIAMHEKLDDRVEFKRKGRGSDGGAECYWITSSGDEICWQAKYFTERLGDSEFSQIERSVKSAIENHPKMVEYIVCVPIDRTDSRQFTKQGVPKQTEMVKWDNKVIKWQELAKNSGINVKFTYWGASELCSYLIKDDGVLNYFFGAHSLTMDSLKEIVHRSQESLGDRYSEDDNVELEISKIFDALAASESWNEKFYKELHFEIKLFSDEEIQKESFLESYNVSIEKIRKCVVEYQKDPLNLTLASELCSLCDTFEDELFSNKDIRNRINQLNRKEEEIRHVNGCNTEKKALSEESRVLYEIQCNIEEWIRKIMKIRRFIKSEECQVYMKRIIILNGEAGVGKSHLLCDNANKLINKGVPTLFILGQHYAGGSPFEFIKSKLDIGECTDKELLKLMNVMAELHNSRFTIIIDAINEGEHRKEWYNYLKDFIEKIKDYSNISLIISCRTTYLNLIVPESVLTDDICQIAHKGFKELEYKAVEQYFSKRNITMLNTPIMSPEFSNPLFLKTCCDALNQKSLTAFPKGVNGFVSIFEFYLTAINDKICRMLGRLNSVSIFEFIDAFVDKLFPDSFYKGISIKCTEQIAEDQFGDKQLIDLLVHEGILSYDEFINQHGRKETIVRFTFERYSEHLLARSLISKCCTTEEVKTLLTDGEVGKHILSDYNYYQYAGLINSLALNIAEKFQCEFIELMDKELYEKEKEFFIVAAFRDNILMRSPNGICSGSVYLLKESEDDAFGILINLATEPNHPWNILYLEKHLFAMTMAERDSCWSVYIARYFGWNEEVLVVEQILSWAKKADIYFIDLKRVELLAYLMIWLTSTTNCFIRDTATKILSKIFYCYPELISRSLIKYKNVNDMYILERIYAAAYGAIVYIRDDSRLLNIYETVYDLQFKNGEPSVNIMIREYAVSIMEYCAAIDITSDAVDLEKCKPPFSSTWNNNIPDPEELDAQEEIYGLSTSLYELGDFQRYVLDCVESWSITPIDSEAFITYSTLQQEFLDKLTDRSKTLYENYLKLKKKKQELHCFSLKLFLNKLEKSDSIYDDLKDDEHKLDDEIKEIHSEILTLLNSTEKDEFNLINKDNGDRIVEFDINLASRYIHQRIIDFGWKNDYFRVFDVHAEYTEGNSSRRIERIGKKYQWIALYELLAKLADNFKWIDRNYDDLIDNEYYSTIQISKRDIDPTMWITGAHYDCYERKEKTDAWWELSYFSFSDTLNITQDEWLINERIIPDFAELIQINRENQKWTVLHGFSKYNKPASTPDNRKEDLWYRINTVIIPEDNVEKFIEYTKSMNLEDPTHFNCCSFSNDLFYGEFNWHKYLQKFECSRDEFVWHYGDYSYKMYIPYYGYIWESDARDYALEESVSCYIPSNVLMNAFNLHNDPLNYGKWYNKENDVIFMDPSVSEKGNGYALINSYYFNDWLKKNKMALVWLVCGEKQVYHAENHNPGFGVYGRVVFNMVFVDSDNGIERKRYDYYRSI